MYNVIIEMQRVARTAFSEETTAFQHAHRARSAKTDASAMMLSQIQTAALHALKNSDTRVTIFFKF